MFVLSVEEKRHFRKVFWSYLGSCMRDPLSSAQSGAIAAMAAHTVLGKGTDNHLRNLQRLGNRTLSLCFGSTY